MSNKILILVFLFGFMVANLAYSLRVNFPPTLSLPLTEEQISQLNQYLKDIWNIQNGRMELDVVSSAKSSAKNGELWLNSTSHKIQWKEGGNVYSAP